MRKRNAAVDATLTLPGISRPVGRPRKADALTNADRQIAFRRRSDLTSYQFSVRFPVHVAAKLKALQEMYPGKTLTRLVGDLLEAALNHLDSVRVVSVTGNENAE